ncbi:MAG: hypothetical protein U0176_11355 [Bacteroidia bacterium]
MRIVVCPKLMPTWCALLLLCWFPSLLHSQSEARPSPKWEVGLQTTSFNPVLGHEFLRYNAFQKFRGGELFLVRHLNDKVFVRAAGGLGMRKYATAVGPHPDPTIVQTGLSSATAVSAEIAIGSDLPRIQKKVLDRLRFRASVGIAYTDLVRYRNEVTLYRDSIAVGYDNETVDNSALWQVPLMFQAGCRLLGNVYVGLEWRCGAAFSLGKNRYTNVAALESDEGYSSTLSEKQTLEPSFNLIASPTAPKFFISIGF